jgi:hypothetical protein
MCERGSGDVSFRKDKKSDSIKTLHVRTCNEPGTKEKEFGPHLELSWIYKWQYELDKEIGRL